MNAALPTVPFTAAKAGLSQIMNRVVGHEPTMIARQNRDAMVLLNPRDLEQALELAGHRFHGSVVYDQGRVFYSLPDFGLIGEGDSFEQAVEDAVELLRDYAQDYVHRFAFYQHTDRHALWPLILRFVLADFRDGATDAVYADMKAAATAEAARYQREPEAHSA